MLPTNLMNAADFRAALGITEDQFTTAGMCGMLPRALGVIGGSPVWAESEVRSYAASNGYAFNGPGTAPGELVVVPPRGADTVSITNGTGEAVHFRLDANQPAARFVFADPGTEVGATQHGKAPTDKSGKVRILRDTLQPQTIEALRALDLSSIHTYAVRDLPAAITQRIPSGMRTASPVLNEDARRDQYTTVQLCDYLGVDDTSLYRVVKRLGIRPRMAKAPSGFGTNHHRVYSDGQASKIRNSAAYKTMRRKVSTEANIRAAVHAWLIPFLGEATADEAAPHRTPVAEGGIAREAAPVVEVIPPDVWLTEKAAADHLGWPVEVLRIARKEKTGPLATFRDKQIMYRVADLDIWRLANTTRADEMKRRHDEELDEFQAAEFVGLTVTTMRTLRNSAGHPTPRHPLRAPAFHRGKKGKPLYWRNDLSAWLVTNAAAVEQRRALINSPAQKAAGEKARTALAAKRAQGESVGGRGHRKVAVPKAPGDKVAAALVTQANARKPATQALNNSLTNGRATFADKLDAHIANSGKVGKKTVVKASRTLAGGRIHH